ncbi:HAMP domain-containing histidine kinase (plasmid) [Polymorphobacter megasporae]|nr:HAMP domain-containing histidine kinase [Polymorphobacter megasporae]
MFSMSSLSPRALATLRWGGAIAAMLVGQSLITATLFWLLAAGGHQRAVERIFAVDCSRLAALTPPKRRTEVRAMLARDIHRDRFIGLFTPSGAPIEGNVARLPVTATGTASVIATVEPTELPGKDSDVARLAVCAMPNGTRLLTGVDLDDAEEALRVVERSLMFGLLPGLLLAVGFGLVAGRRAAKQVDAVRSLTEHIVAGHLHQRLAVEAHPDSFGVLCAHINAMLDRVQSLVADVRGVGDDIAHQLRTPLTRLRARIERSLREATDPTAFAMAGDAALAEIDQLLGIVAALLRIRELADHARRSRFAPVDLARLVEDACDLYRPIAEDRGIDLVCDIEPVIAVDGDASLLIEAVANLLDNAMKFGPAGGRVVLSLRQEGDVPVITVTDDGPGVPAAERSLVTQRFYRGAHDYAGAGLGLSLVKAIGDLHGFTLRFAGQGSAVALVGPGGEF